MALAKRLQPLVATAASRSSSLSISSTASKSRDLAKIRLERLVLEAQFLKSEQEHLDVVDSLLEKEKQIEERTEGTESSTGHRLLLNFDGASKNNPGESGLGWVLRNVEGGSAIALGWKYLGDSSTNNEAEYAGLIEGLRYVERKFKTFESLEVNGDSTLVVQQVLGNWKCKSPNLMPLSSLARSLLSKLSGYGPVDVRYIPREENPLADALSNIAVVHRNEALHEDLNGIVDLGYLRSRFGL